MEQKQLFRKVALERLSSPEQLDQLMQVTTPIGWVSLIALIILLIMVIVWGIFGTIPTKVMGMGILIKSGGVFNIVPVSSGQISDLRANMGDLVKTGEVVARIAQPELLDQLREARAKLGELEQQHKLIYEFGTKDLKLQTDAMAKERENVKQSIKANEDQVKWLKERIGTQEQLLKEGLITKQDLINTKQQLDSTKLEIEQSRNQLKQIAVKELQIKNQREQDLLNIQQNINEQKIIIASLEDKLDLDSRVISPYTGRILEVMVEIGDILKPGYPILSLELVGKEIKELEAVIYVPSVDGKKVKAGMDVQISPTIVKREEFGFMRGKVISVAEFPATDEGMMSILNNENLVKMLSGSSAPIEIYSDLIPDNNTVSGYKWSSPKGPPLKIHSGTICTVTITVMKQPPISLVIPLMKKYLLGVGT